MYGGIPELGVLTLSSPPVAECRLVWLDFFFFFAPTLYYRPAGVLQGFYRPTSGQKGRLKLYFSSKAGLMDARTVSGLLGMLGTPRLGAARDLVF